MNLFSYPNVLHRTDKFFISLLFTQYLTMKKICFIAKTAPRYREAIFKAMDAEFDIDWYFGETKSDIKEMDTTELKNVHYYKIWGNSNKCSWKRGVIPLLFKKEYQNIMMHVETRAVSDWILVLLKSIFFPKKKLVTWAHGWYGKESRVEAAMKLWLYRRLNQIFVYGQHAKNMMVAKGIPEEKIFVIHNSLHYDEQKALRESIKPSDIYKSHFGNDYPVLVFIGRLTKVKKLDQLLAALRILMQTGENYNLVFVGNGTEKEALEQITQSEGLSDRVWFYGACYDEKTNAELLYNADLCVAPGNIGLTAMHSLVFGCPCVSHNSFEWQMPEFEAIREGVTGSFFKMNNVESLAECISKWFATKKNKREEVRLACFKEIDTSWNPYFQMNVLRNNLKLV